MHVFAQSMKKAIIPVWHSGDWPPPKLRLSLTTTNHIPKVRQARMRNVRQYIYPRHKYCFCSSQHSMQSRLK